MTGIVIEGEDLQVDPRLVDGARMRLKPGFYVRDRGELLSVRDPIYPERVRAALGLGEATRNLIAVHLDGEPVVLESAVNEIECFPLGYWRAAVHLFASDRRPEAVTLWLPATQR
ncbi:hypothetical protein PMNALOAF_2694 [Methylobacterium adhaesivum]|uniref:Uncharacterized protein n=1 Tax=Methylobacterium adhaesivum TaxID=333297 RepID=A0ABT8BJQ6_9HYPH|nr:hypothetical protein [Methylobacterium adhaesivum]MDN3592048.1 hypothetical protein [Methylobacterium adhaesivum]GJD31435.1 hypothetical protein PMNALOAF_2694 [Methylobacterium adhaesivum]